MRMGVAGTEMTEPVRACSCQDIHRPQGQETELHESPSERPRSRLVFVICIMNVATVVTVMHFMVPFFPAVAMKKAPDAGATSHFLVGAIFGISALMEVPAAPLIGKDLPNIGGKTLLVLTSIVLAGVNFLFAFVEQIRTWKTFIALTLLLRVIYGISRAGNTVASYAVLLKAYPESAGSVSGVIRATTSLGNALGPLFGGLLYDLGGFRLPFYVASAIVVVNSVLVAVLLPSSVHDGGSTDPSSVKGSSLSGEGQDETYVKGEVDFKYGKLLKTPWLWIVLISVVIGNTKMSYLEPTMPTYFRSVFHTSVTVIGISWLVYSCVSSGFSLLIGYCIDHRGARPRLLLPAGLAVMGISFQLVGPTTLLPLAARSIWTSFTGLALLGLGNGLAMVSAMPDILNAVRDSQLGNTHELRAAVAGLLRGAFSLGSTVGPVVGSVLTGAVGFQQSASLLGGVYLLLTAVFIVGAWLYERQLSK